MFDVCGLGDALLDFRPVKSTAGTDCFEPNPGGTIANMICASSILGLKSAILGKVGYDRFGLSIADVLREKGVNIDGLVYDHEARTTLSFVYLDENGDRSFSFYRNPGADFMLKPHEVNDNIIMNSRVFHFSAMALTDEPVRSACKSALQTALKNGLLISCDVNMRQNLWSDLSTARKTILEQVKEVNILKASEEEMKFLSGCSDVASATNTIYKQFGTKLITTTLGHKGCYYKHCEDEGWMDTYKVKAVDTTGAGDAFMAAMLFKYISLGKDLSMITKNEIVEILDFANAAGALSVTRFGSISSMPCTEEVVLFKSASGQQHRDKAYL